MRVISKNGKAYYPVDPEIQRVRMLKYYDTNKTTLVRKKILDYGLGHLGRIPTLGSIEKYSITPGELILHFENFKKVCQDAEVLEKSQAKLMKRISKKWT